MNIPYTAMMVAKLAHKGQFDKAGEDYFLGHVTRVVGKVAQSHDLVNSGHLPQAVSVAYLHDVVEDTDVTIYDLANVFEDDIAAAVGVLTRKKDEQYFAYIHRVAHTSISFARIARRVKIADLEDHLERKEFIPESLVKRYEKALEILREVEA